MDFVHQVSFDDDGNFFVVYNFADDDDNMQRLRFAKWTGSSWNVGSIEEAPFSSNEIRMNSLIKIPGGDAFRISIAEPGINNTVRIQETTDGSKNWTLISSQTIEANGQTINSADFVVPYNPGYPQLLVTTFPEEDKYNTTLPGDYPVWAIGDGTDGAHRHLPD